MGFCCGCPFLAAAVIALVHLWRRGGESGKKVALAGASILILFIGLAIYSEGRYIMLEEGIVMDACDGNAAGVAWRLRMGGSAKAKTDNDLSALGCASTNGHVE